MAHLKNYRYKPDAGNAWNPLKGFPRNNPCFCGSEIKAKHCCLPKTLEYCSAKTAGELRRVWPDIISGKHLVQLTFGENTHDDVNNKEAQSGQSSSEEQKNQEG